MLFRSRRAHRKLEADPLSVFHNTPYSFNDLPQIGHIINESLGSGEKLIDIFHWGQMM